ncbi:NAD(+) hydrolase sarm1 isoform X5 [Lutzomyia longipalpis]|uniref:NAD(+) hydrolase sarm1 isoform X5 n=1 Tax=Lutzomyia longipalpis TaxID=7200 RepID=UPI002483F866|nr:NAD(+) hydrolase sarm1 isoform X5 [Lutzomyia longipalpis]
MQTAPPRHKFRRASAPSPEMAPHSNWSLFNRRLYNDTMSDFPEAQSHVTPEMAAILENLQKKNALTSSTTATSARQNLINSSSIKETSSSLSSSSTSSSQQVVNSSSSSSSSSSTTTSRVAKTSSSQRLHHVTASSTSEMKATALQRNLTDFKNSMTEINNLASMGRTTTQTTAMSQLKSKIRSSLENLVDSREDQPLVTFPDGDGPDNDLQLDLSPAISSSVAGDLATTTGAVDTVKFEQKSMTSASKTKVVTDGYSTEQASSNSAEMKRLQAGDVDYQESKAASAMRNRVEVDGISAEQNAAMLKEARSLKSGDMQQQESNSVAAASMKVHSDTFTAEKKAITQAQQRQMVTSSGIFNQEKHVSSASQSNFTITKKGISTGASMISSSTRKTNGFDEEYFGGFDDLESLCSTSNPKDVERAISKYTNYLDQYVKNLQTPEQMTTAPPMLDKINEIIRKAWAVPTYGHELGYTLCNELRSTGGLDLLMRNCVEGDKEIQFSSARLLEQCLTTENRSHVVENGLEKVVNVACVCTKNTKTDHSRVGTGILEHLFKHSEGTCSDVIRLGGLDAVLFECRKNDVETLRHCAGALANLSLYGGAENQEAMINRKVPMWLFPLAFHDDDNIKYYACLAIAVLVANKEIEAEVLKSGTLDLVEPFVTSHNPSEFAKSNLAHAHGQSKHWLQRLVPVLSSKREEARNLAAFHFCMEAGIKKEQGNTEIFREIGAIEPLKNVASCPNAIASKFAAQALRLIGEEVPHKLSQQVPLWTTEDVREWVKQIGFGDYERNFYESRVDGDLLLQLNEENLREDIGIVNGIQRKRFMREMQNLKKMADYSSRDSSSLNQFLQNIGMEYSIYTYSMLNAGVDKESLRHLNDDQLISECGITNSIHRLRILNNIKSIFPGMESSMCLSSEENPDKTLDVFVSYRRNNGSQLASLLKVHLQLRGFSVFIDVERLEAGKFDNNLLQSIRQAKHFILVLTPRALERCIEDFECKDWVHREIVAALNSNCNIIPIIDNFSWPEPENLPEDMRSVCHFNGVRWIHDYQDACVDKLERFMRGELNMKSDGFRGPLRGDGTPSTPSTASTTRQNPPIYQRMHSNDSNKGGDNGRISD